MREILPGVESLRLTFDPAGTQKVYKCHFASTRRNPFEAVGEVTNRSVLDAAIPSRVHRCRVSRIPSVTPYLVHVVPQFQLLEVVID
jgi:hypothetical protein